MTVYRTRIKAGPTPGTGKMVIWEKPPSGDPMAPYDDPVANLQWVRFCSDFQYYNNAVREDGVSISHASVAGVTGTGYAPASFPGVGTGSIANGQVVTATHSLYTHGLGYAPLFFVLYDDVIVSNGLVVQEETNRLRMVSAYATTTEIRLKEVGISSTAALSAVSRSYDVIVLRDPAVVPGSPLYRAKSTEVVLGYGKMTSEQRALRRPTVADPTMYLPVGQNADVRNGAIRTISPSGQADLGTYIGPLFSAPYLEVTI